MNETTTLEDRLFEPAQVRQAAARGEEADTHKEWHRLFGDDCRKAGCPARKEASK